MVTLLVIVIIATGARGYSQSVSICVYDTYVICYIELIKNFSISIFFHFNFNFNSTGQRLAP